MATHNEHTGDAIKSGKGNPKLFKENLGKIKPSCYKDCNYLVNTLTKCRVCSWHPDNKENNGS
jgi:hypothetical protein